MGSSSLNEIPCRGLAQCPAGDPCQKRVMGLEPTTFTLATCLPTPAKYSNCNDLDETAYPFGSALAALTVSAGQSAVKSESDSDLIRLIEAWPRLSPSARRAVLNAADATRAIDDGWQGIGWAGVVAGDTETRAASIRLTTGLDAGMEAASW